MKKMIIAALTALTLSAGVASAATGTLFPPANGYTQGGAN